MKSPLRASKAQVVYQLFRDGNLEDPHIIDVRYPSDQDGLLLRDVKKRLATLRGKGMTELFSWSYKRNYKIGFIWSDLSDYDVIHPLRGSGEYLVKASELIDSFATRTSVHSNEFQVKKKVHSSIPSHATSPQVANESCHLINTPKQIHEPAGCCYSSPKLTRNLSFDDYKNLTVEQSAKTDTGGLNSSVQLEQGGKKNHQRGGVISSRSAQISEVLSEEENAVGGALRSVKDKPSTLSVEQETIDLERSDFCLSSSDSETSPREEPVAKDIVVRGEALVIRTWSPSVVQEAESPALVSLGSPLCTPGGTRRLWKKDIKRSLFRADQNLNSQVNAAGLVENIATVDGARRSTSRSNVSLYNGRSKSARVSGFNAVTTLQKDEVEPTTPHSNLVKMLWARWTGGSKRRPIVVRSSGDTKNAVQEVSPVGLSHTILKAAELRSLQSESRSTGEDKACELREKEGDHSLKEEKVCHSGRRPATTIEGNSVITATTEVTSSKCITPACKSSSAPGVQQLILDQSPDSVLLVKETSPASPCKSSQPQTPVASPRTAIPRVRVRTVDSVSNVANGIASSPGKGIPPGFHKGTNDTKPRITRKSTRSPINSASSPPSARSFKGNSLGCSSGRWTIFHEVSARNTVALGVSTDGLLDQKAISFQERDERPLIPGLTILDWERTLEEVVKDSLPPPDFKDILQECSTCGRKFKPDSLKVHKRGCCSIRRARAFNTSPHIVQPQASPRLSLPEIMV